MKVDSPMQRAVRTMDQAHPSKSCGNTYAVMAHYRYSIRRYVPIDRGEKRMRRAEDWCGERRAAMTRESITR